MNELALFAGAGGGILGGKLLGWRTVCAVEWDQYAATVLAQRQNDGFLEAFPIWDDVQTFDGRPWQGIVDVISGGFPCQDISVAGKGAGIDGERSGMWKHMARIIGEVRPQYVFVENSPNLVRNGLARVLGDLAALGYDARWGIIGADDVGAPHHRKRIWILAYPVSSGEWRITWKSEIKGDVVADANSPQRKRAGFTGRSYEENANANSPSAWWRQDPAEIPESGMGRMADGVAHRVDRLKALGNGQVPSVAALAWRILSETL
jgi:DNA (cytosine-5)-methyltransferase 1